MTIYSQSKFVSSSKSGYLCTLKERNNEPFALMIHGHPSSGKSTAMRQIFKHFSSQIQTTGKPRKVIPIFSEIQNSKTLGSSEESGIWMDVVGGAQSFVFRASDISNTLTSFATFAAEEGALPIFYSLTQLTSSQSKKMKLLERIGTVFERISGIECKSRFHL